MFEFMALLALALAAAIIFGVLFSLGSLLLGLITLPFTLLGLVFRGLGVLLALPFLLVFGLIGVALFGAGVLVFLVPALPVLLLIALALWLVRRTSHRARSTTA